MAATFASVSPHGITVRADMSGRFDVWGDQISALQERGTPIKSKITGLRRRIERHLQLREAA